MSAAIHFISAGAGSGKTHRLTQLLHEKLLSGQIRPAGVIATTFTKKAAAELRQRVRSHLLAQGELQLAHASQLAHISTVNSLCGSLLQRFAFEAGLTTQQHVLEENRTELLIKQAIDAALNSTEATELWSLSQRMGIEDWREELHALVNIARANDIDAAKVTEFGADNAADLLSYYPAKCTINLTGELRSAIAAALPALIEVAAGGKKNSNDYLNLVREVDRNPHRWSDWYKLAKTLPEKAAQPLAESINAIAARVAEHADLQVDIQQYLGTIFALCARTLNFYAEQKRAMGVLDFIDQEHLLLKVLQQPSVTAILSEELDLLLVDEFQDTSPIQLAIFIKLAECARETVWVGDIKQAIYGFRGSDTALMHGVLNQLRDNGSQLEILSSSWRSRPALVNLINQVFSAAFLKSHPVAEILLQPKRSELLNTPVLANWLLDGKNKEQEGLSLVSGIQRLLSQGDAIIDPINGAARPVQLSDIAILCRMNSQVIDIAGKLRSAGLATSTAQPGLLATPESVLSMACLRRLNDVSDTIATAEILALADCAEPESWLLERLQYLAQGGQRNTWRESGDNAHPLIVKLATMRSALSALTPKEVVQYVMTECDLAGIVLRWKQDESLARIRLANLEALLNLAAQYEADCQSMKQASSLSGLIIWLQDAAADQQDYCAQPAIDAINVLTHHAAKGLEWPVVILTELNADVKDRLWGVSAISRQGFDARLPLKDRQIRYWPWPFGKQSKVALADAIAQSAVAKQFHHAATEESRRLLYVSMTRARDLLILARSKRDPVGEWLNTLNSPWLLPEQQDNGLGLPNGETINAHYWELSPRELSARIPANSTPLFWFASALPQAPRVPLSFSPSSTAPRAGHVIASFSIGQRIALIAHADLNQVGSAIHACLAAAMTDSHAFIALAEIEEILAGHSSADVISPVALLNQIKAFSIWLNIRWPSARRYAEINVESVLGNNQILRGKIDLLLEIERGWILIDHKANPQGSDQWNELVTCYSGQLASYIQAIESSTGKPVLETWLYLPVAGAMLQVNVN